MSHRESVGAVARMYQLDISFDQSGDFFTQAILAGTISYKLSRDGSVIDHLSAAATCDDAFPLPSGTAVLQPTPDAIPGPAYLSSSVGFSLNIENLLLSEGSKRRGTGILLHYGGVGVEQVSQWSQSCIATTTSFLVDLENKLRNLANGAGATIGSIGSSTLPKTNAEKTAVTALVNWINSNVVTTLSSNVTRMPQPVLGINESAKLVGLSGAGVDPTATFSFSLSRQIEKEVKVLYSVTGPDNRTTTREAFIKPGERSSETVSISSLFSTWAGGTTLDPAITRAAKNNQLYTAATYGAALTPDLIGSYRIAVDGYQVLYGVNGAVDIPKAQALWNYDASGNPNGYWYFDGQPGFSTNLASETLMFGGGLHDQTFTIRPVIINSVRDLNAINDDLSGSYVLGKDLDLSRSNFVVIGSVDHPFTGTLDGAGHEITGLRIRTASADGQVGMFATIGSTGTVKNLTLAAVDIVGPSTASGNNGALVGLNQGTVDNVHVSGSVKSPSEQVPAGPGYTLGGLVGHNEGVVRNSSSTAQVLAQTGVLAGVGGLVGFNAGRIEGSSATGMVENDAFSFYGVGGLAGWGDGTITGSYSSGSVLGGQTYYGVGGLVGGGYYDNISLSYSDATVSGASMTGVGGLIGFNGGSIRDSYALGTVTGSIIHDIVQVPNSTYYPYQFGAGIGGLVGTTRAGAGLVGSVTTSYAAGAVTTLDPLRSPAGGLVGGGNVPATKSFWDVQSTGQPKSNGGHKRTTAELQSGNLPPGFNSSAWTASAGSYPALQWQTSGSMLAQHAAELGSAGLSATAYGMGQLDDALHVPKGFLLAPSTAFPF